MLTLGQRQSDTYFVSLLTTCVVFYTSGKYMPMSLQPRANYRLRHFPHSSGKFTHLHYSVANLLPVVIYLTQWKIYRRRHLPYSVENLLSASFTYLSPVANLPPVSFILLSDKFTAGIHLPYSVENLPSASFALLQWQICRRFHSDVPVP
jgi:hypothetical protein